MVNDPLVTHQEAIRLIVKDELRPLNRAVESLTQTLKDDNGNSVLSRLKHIEQTCENRPRECDTKFNSIRQIALTAQEAANHAGDEPRRTVSRWTWLVAGATGLLMLLAGAASALGLKVVTR